MYPAVDDKTCQQTQNHTIAHQGKSITACLSATGDKNQTSNP